jgi:hypothetical protein
MDGFKMKRLHQGCGESLQSNLPGIPLARRGRIMETGRSRQMSDRGRLKNRNLRAESVYR